MQIVGYINTNIDYLHGQKMKPCTFSLCNSSRFRRGLGEAFTLLEGYVGPVGVPQTWLISCKPTPRYPTRVKVTFALKKNCQIFFLIILAIVFRSAQGHLGHERRVWYALL